MNEYMRTIISGIKAWANGVFAKKNDVISEKEVLTLVKNKGFLMSIPDEYITEDVLDERFENSGYLSSTAAGNIYLSKTDASSEYVKTKSEATLANLRIKTSSETGQTYLGPFSVSSLSVTASGSLIAGSSANDCTRVSDSGLDIQKYVAGGEYFNIYIKTEQTDDKEYVVLSELYVANASQKNRVPYLKGLKGIVLKSSTADSEKQFMLTVDDSGAISAVEVG